MTWDGGSDNPTSQNELDRLYKRLTNLIEQREPSTPLMDPKESLRIDIFLWLKRLTRRRPRDVALTPEARRHRLGSKGLYLCDLHGSSAAIVTAAFYGPDDGRATKLVLSLEPGDAMSRWSSTNLLKEENILREAKAFLSAHAPKALTATGGTVGCPHEEGIDFPSGLDCPQCPFWGGRQGSASTSMS